MSSDSSLVISSSPVHLQSSIRSPKLQHKQQMLAQQQQQQQQREQQQSRLFNQNNRNNPIISMQQADIISSSPSSSLLTTATAAGGPGGGVTTAMSRQVIGERNNDLYNSNIDNSLKTYSSSNQDNLLDHNHQQQQQQQQQQLQRYQHLHQSNLSINTTSTTFDRSGSGLLTTVCDNININDNNSISGIGNDINSCTGGDITSMTSEQQLCQLYNAQQHSDYIISDYMDKISTRISLLETELKFAWRALDLLSGEYGKMWTRLEKLENITIEQQSVVANLMGLYGHPRLLHTLNDNTMTESSSSSAVAAATTVDLLDQVSQAPIAAHEFNHMLEELKNEALRSNICGIGGVNTSNSNEISFFDNNPYHIIESDLENIRSNTKSPRLLTHNQQQQLLQQHIQLQQQQQMRHSTIGNSASNLLNDVVSNLNAQATNNQSISHGHYDIDNDITGASNLGSGTDTGNNIGNDGNNIGGSSSGGGNNSTGTSSNINNYASDNNEPTEEFYKTLNQAYPTTTTVFNGISTIK
ncbi:putative uncharacterized protein DDB_G0282129 [Condylostylus longicornis]|uniref:putative uncharacterized protein DDB_G0282129 n=1 Tax=Condylostylus longicornis TaxID=2530218 RepID=UPI00244E46BB|nr:putative uncharacterized protein DDB_G0282129 [Condylostylus longicornis]